MKRFYTITIMTLTNRIGPNYITKRGYITHINYDSEEDIYDEIVSIVTEYIKGEFVVINYYLGGEEDEN